VVIPDPIPNSEVKHLRANGTARVTAWESRTLPELIMERPQVETPGVFFMFCARGALWRCRREAPSRWLVGRAGISYSAFAAVRAAVAAACWIARATGDLRTDAMRAGGLVRHSCIETASPNGSPRSYRR
jgi:hypothetical protein